MKKTLANNRKIVKIIIVVLVLLITSAILYAGSLFKATSPITPLTYFLTSDPTNATILQDQPLNATVTASYLKGNSESVTLTANPPNCVTCAFVNASGTPTEGDPFKSTLQITAPSNASSGKYEFNITSTSKSGKINSTTFTLTVLNGFINVSGRVTANFDEEIIPTEIVFEDTKTKEKFSTGVLTTPITGVPARSPAGLVQTGRYWVMLPNNSDYSVTCTWIRMPLPGAHFDRAASGSFSGGKLTVHCGVGLDFLTNNNYDDGA